MIAWKHISNHFNMASYALYLISKRLFNIFKIQNPPIIQEKHNLLKMYPCELRAKVKFITIKQNYIRLYLTTKKCTHMFTIDL